MKFLGTLALDTRGTAALHLDDSPEGRHLRTHQNLGLAVCFIRWFLSWQELLFRDGFFVNKNHCGNKQGVS